MLSTVTSKGQVTVPKKLREKFGIHSQDKIEFSVAGDHIILKPVKTLQDLRGCVQGSGDPEQERQAAKQAVGRRVVDEMT